MIYLCPFYSVGRYQQNTFYTPSGEGLIKAIGQIAKLVSKCSQVMPSDITNSARGGLL